MLARLAVVLLTVSVAGPALAANARNPYGNVDRRNDVGNDTGNSQVDDLNRAQLNQNYYRGAPPPGLGAPMPPYGYAPPPYGYAPPPPPPYGYGR